MSAFLPCLPVKNANIHVSPACALKCKQWSPAVTPFTHFRRAQHSDIVCMDASKINDVEDDSVGDPAFDVHETGQISDGTQPPSIASNTGAPLHSAKQAEGGTKTTAYRPFIDYELQPGEIGVRFINGPKGVDVIAAAQPGENLLSVGDSVGVHIPRACQSGLCGSCTCDLLDTSQPDGRQTVRACQTGVSIPDDGPELIVDVSRMKTAKKGKDPMSRFENLDTGYVAGAAPREFAASGTFFSSMECRDCNGDGKVVCEDCEGSGVDLINGSGLCIYCLGMRQVRCATCQGSGEVKPRR